MMLMGVALLCDVVMAVVVVSHRFVGGHGATAILFFPMIMIVPVLLVSAVMPRA